MAVKIDFEPTPQKTKIDFEPSTPTDAPLSLGKAVSNFPASVLDNARMAITALTHPTQTIPAVVRPISGAIEKATGIFKNEGDIQAFDAVKEAMVKRYGNLNNLKRTIENDPAGFMSDISSILSGAGGLATKAGTFGKLAPLARAGKALGVAGEAVEPLGLAAKGVGEIAHVAGEGVTGLLGLTTGAGYKNVREALFNPNKTFRDSMRGKISQGDIVDTALNGMEKIKEQRSKAYTDQLQVVQANRRAIDIQPIFTEFHKQLQKFKVGREPLTGELDFTLSPLGKSAQNEIKEIGQHLEEWVRHPQNDRSAVVVDSLKRRLDDFYSDSSQARALVERVRDVAKNQILKEVPEYGKLVGDYEKASKNIKDIQSAFSLTGRAGSDTVIRKLTQTLRQNFEFRNELAKQLQAASGKNLISMIAGNQVSQLEPKGLSRLGTYVAGGAGAAMAAKGVMNPHFLGMLGLASPRLMGEFLSAVGLTGKAIGATMNAVYNPNLAQGAVQAGRIKEAQKK